MATRKSRPAKAKPAQSKPAQAKPAQEKPAQAAPAAEAEAIHLPPPSYWPIALALGIVLIAIGIIFSLIISGVGVLVMLAAIVGWTQENRDIALRETHHE